MKATGVVRNLDQLGRIVLPAKLRREIGIREGDDMEMFVDEDRILLKKYLPSCVFCGGVKAVQEYKGKLVCRGCMGELGR